MLGIHLSETFPIKNCLKDGGALSPLLFNYALEYAMSGVQAFLELLKLTNKFLIYADDVNILGGNIHNTKKYTESLVAAIKKIRLNVNAEKTK